MQESNFNVIIDAENYNAVIGESAKIDAGQAINYIKSGEAEIEQAVDAGIAEFDSNATAKTNAFNQNAGNKTIDFNNNASAKTQDYNDNAVAKTIAFNDNATSKTNDFNTNATNKTNAFNQNATDKTLTFNTNAAEKQAAVDASAVLAASFANQSKQYAIGDPTEPLGNSAKYWAEQASSSVTGLGARVDAIEGKIPSTATANNQLTDKSYVDTADSSLQQQIDAITAASDVSDIVGTYAALLAYDTSTLQNNNIIKVLQDETHNNETTYYRWVITGGVGAWVLIGEEGPYYTIAAADATFQEKLVSGTNIKTVNGNSLVGSGNVDIDALPSQTGQGGKFLTTDGTDPSWATVNALPSQTGQSGKFLTTDGTDASWATVGALPSQTGQSGKFLTTDGTDASWGSPDLSGKADVNLSNVNNTGKSLGAGWAMPSDTYDDLTFGASGATYTAPANGWFTIDKATTGAQYLALINTNNKIKTESRATNSGQTLRLFLPVKKNDVVECLYSAAGTLNCFRFVYAVGSESEAQNV